MTEFDTKLPAREEIETRYALFEQFLFEDQRRYYDKKVDVSRTAAEQVTFWHALFAFLTGLSSALAALLLAEGVTPDGTCAVNFLGRNCEFWTPILVVLPIFSVIFPAVAAAFGSGRSYQWDRLASVYEATRAA